MKSPVHIPTGRPNGLSLAALSLWRAAGCLPRAVRWLRRFPHRQGYGIHSPFAFGLVTGVIYERGAYYAYAPLRATRRAAPCPLRERDDRLLLRLANAAAPHTALVWGRHTDVTLSYLRAGRSSARFVHIGDTAATPPGEAVARAATVDFLYVDDAERWPDVWRAAVEAAGDRAFFVVRGIRRTRRDHLAWQQLTADERVRVTFDLHDFGIACFERRFNKENYVINYF